jgi:hypothetical protein
MSRPDGALGAEAHGQAADAAHDAGRCAPVIAVYGVSSRISVVLHVCHKAAIA